MSQSTVHYLPPSNYIKNVRTVFSIPAGIHVLPSTLRELNIKINPKDAQGNSLEAYYPALAGVLASFTQLELNIGGKIVDIFQSKDFAAFQNSLGTPDAMQDIAQPMTASNNVVFQTPDQVVQTLQYVPVDAVPASIEFSQLMDYLRERNVISEGLQISITYDSRLTDWLLDAKFEGAAATVASVDIEPGYLSFESVQDISKFPKQEFVDYHQTISEQLYVPAIPTDNTSVTFETRINSLRDKYVTRCLVAAQPTGSPADISTVRKTFGKLCSIPMFGEQVQLNADGQTVLTFKNISNLSFKLSMLEDAWGPSTASQSAHILPVIPALVDSQGDALSGYYSYLGIQLERYINRELVLQYTRKSGVNADYPSQAAQLSLFFISQVLRRHNLATGETTYIKA